MIRRSTFVFLTACATLALSASVAMRASEPQSEPLAPAKYKNIQFLKDMPASQLDMTMQYFSAALGWQCQNCHVRDQATGEFQYDKDQNNKKKVGPMIELVRTINEGDFGAKINCATCHQGHNSPAGLAAATPYTADQLAAMAAQEAARAAQAARQGGPGGEGRPGGAPGQPGAPGQQPGGRGPAQAPPPPPPVEPIIAKFVKAMGGDALAKLQSRVTTGTVVNRANVSMPFTIEEKSNKYRLSVTDPRGPQVLAFDGKAGWGQVGPAVVDLDTFKTQQALRLNDLRRVADFAKRYTNLQAGRPTRLPARTPGGQPIQADLIQGDIAPNVQERLFIDQTSGLLLRRQIISRAFLNGALVETIDYSDYKDVAGVQVPFTIKHNTWNTLDTYTVVDVKTGASIDDAKFNKPSGK